MYCIVHKVFYSLSQYLKSRETKTKHIGITATASTRTIITTTTTPVVAAAVVVVTFVIVIKTFNNFGIHLL